MKATPLFWSLVSIVLASALRGAPAAAATITVTSTGDTIAVDGVVTLREAIASVNMGANVNADVVATGTYGTNDAIHFDIPGTGVQTITPGSSLPTIVKPVTIDGYTQHGASANTLATGDNAVLKIELDGATVGGGAGIDVQTIGSTVRGLVIHGFNSEIRFSVSGGGNRVIGNFIGVDPTGTSSRPCAAGVLSIDLSNNTIGGTAPADRNVISGCNPAGVDISGGSGTVVQGNYIGTNASGTAAIPNAFGVSLQTQETAATDSLVGGAAVGAGNLISGNRSQGISITGPSNTVQGNLIGTDVTGSAPLGNGSGGGGNGIFVATSGNTIGGTTPGEGNVIAFNNASGVVVAAGTGNTIRLNSIYSNGNLGIDLGNDGVTANDTGDADTGANDLQNFPMITSTSASTVQGKLMSNASTTYTIDLYASPSCSPAGYGQGKTFLGTKTMATDGGGDLAFTATVAVPAGQIVTATATDPSGNTSEFSQCAFLFPAALEVDISAGAGSDGDGVLEPGETVVVAPTWMNPTAVVTAGVTGDASSYAGPPGATYGLVDGSANYGSIPRDSPGSCRLTPDCYSMSVSDPATRPAAHWDGSFTETLHVPGLPDSMKNWKLHVGDSFADVPRSELFYKKIETIFHNGITVGCTGTTYCPSDEVPRSQMAIFIARGIAHGTPLPVSGTFNGKPYNCIAGGTSAFADVSPTDIFCKAVHYIAAKNVTGGCDATHYCPTPPVSRAEMAIFMAKAIVAPGGGPAVPATYGPDPVTHLSYSCNPASPNLFFTDVSTSDSFCKHVHFLWAKGVIAGCSFNQYCPAGTVHRDEMAKFLSNAFNLQLYGP